MGTGLARFAVGVSLLLFINFDPLGLRFAVDSQSAAIFDRLFTLPFYDVDNSGTDGERAPISVVLIDEGYVADVADGRWPLRYKQQQQLLKEIVRYEPAAIFLDLFFLYQHDDSDISEYLSFLKESSVPIYVPLVMQTNLTSPCEQKPLSDKSNLVEQSQNLEKVKLADLNFVFVNWTGCENSMPLFVGRKAMSPAMAMYAQYRNDQLNKKDDTASTSDSEKRPQAEKKWEQLDEARFQNPMQVQWGIHASPIQRAVIRANGGICQSGAESTWPYIGRQLLGMVEQGFYTSSLPPTFEDCVHLDTIAASYLDSRSKFYERFDNDKTLQDDLAVDYIPYLPQKTITEKYVFIGADLPAIDRYSNHIYASIPGVFVHAMAAHNLMTYHANYVRPMHILGKYLTELFVLLILVSIDGIRANRIASRLSYERYLAERSLRWHLVELVCFKFLLPIGVAGLTMLAIKALQDHYELGRYAVADWLAIALVGMLCSRYGVRHFFVFLFSSAGLMKRKTGGREYGDF